MGAPANGPSANVTKPSLTTWPTLRPSGTSYTTHDGDSSTPPSTAKDINPEDETAPCDRKKSQSQLPWNVAVNTLEDSHTTRMTVTVMFISVACHRTVTVNPTIPTDSIAVKTVL